MDNITILTAISTKFEVAFPEKPENEQLSKSVWSCNSRYEHYDLPMHCFNFYDWFCHDFSLKNKAKRLYGIVRSVGKAMRDGQNIDIGKWGFTFKNNCPCYGDGRLYDDIRISDENGDVIYNICPRDPFGHIRLFCEGHGFESDTEGYKFNSMKELVDWFKKAA